MSALPTKFGRSGMQPLFLIQACRRVASKSPTGVQHTQSANKPLNNRYTPVSRLSSDKLLKDCDWPKADVRKSVFELLSRTEMIPKTRLLATLTILICCWSNAVYAEDASYWSIELPVPDFATNVVTNLDRQFLVRTMSFDWAGRPYGWQPESFRSEGVRLVVVFDEFHPAEHPGGQIRHNVEGQIISCIRHGDDSTRCVR